MEDLTGNFTLRNRIVLQYTQSLTLSIAINSDKFVASTTPVDAKHLKVSIKASAVNVEDVRGVSYNILFSPVAQEVKKVLTLLFVVINRPTESL